MHADNWAIKAKNMGFRSRAVFKLEEILKKIDSKKRYQNVLDIGSSPEVGRNISSKNMTM